MKSVLTQSNGALGTEPYTHMSLLVWAPQRVLALRLALARSIRPNSIVLDAGCGALGVLAVMAAKAGAAKVIAVDVGDLELARRLAEENGVADRIVHVQGDLHEALIPAESFDVIIGMIYNCDIKLDLPQQNLMRALGERYARADTIFIPNKVQYSVTGSYLPGGDFDPSKRRVELEKHIDNAERYTGMTFSACREMVRQDQWHSQSFEGNIRFPFYSQIGHFDRSNLTMLTERTPFSEICYNDRPEQYLYPETCSLPVIHPGWCNAVIWQQDLVFDDILIRTTETINLVTPPSIVEPGMTVTIQTGQDWGNAVPIDVKGGISGPFFDSLRYGVGANISEC
jgi:SAM-dependent methyltransferase